MKLLLAQKADVNQVTRSGKTALMFASSLGFLDLVRLLLSHDANAIVTDADGFSALKQAPCLYYHTGILDALSTYNRGYCVS